MSKFPSPWERFKEGDRLNTIVETTFLLMFLVLFFISIAAVISAVNIFMHQGCRYSLVTTYE